MGKYGVCQSNIILLTVRDHNYGAEVSERIIDKMDQRDMKKYISRWHASVSLMNFVLCSKISLTDTRVCECVLVKAVCVCVCVWGRGWMFVVDRPAAAGVFSFWCLDSKWAAKDDVATGMELPMSSEGCDLDFPFIKNNRNTKTATEKKPAEFCISRKSVYCGIN